MSAPTAREFIDRMGKAEDGDAFTIQEYDALIAIARRALDALESVDPEQYAPIALADINALAARGETGGTP